MAFTPVSVGYLALKAIAGTSLISDIDEWSKAVLEEITAKMLSYSQDTLAKRPAAAQALRLFRATDTGQLQHDTGALWEPLFGPGMGAWTDGGEVGEGAHTNPSSTRHIIGMLYGEGPAGVSFRVEANSIVLGKATVPGTAATSAVIPIWLEPGESYSIVKGTETKVKLRYRLL